MTNINNNLKKCVSSTIFPEALLKIDIAILSAMSSELDFIKEKLSDFKSLNYVVDGFEFDIYYYKKMKVVVSHAGIGTSFTASILTIINTNFRPEYVLFSGTAGGINPKLNISDVVIVEKSFEIESQDLFSLLKNTPFEQCLTHPLNKKNLPFIYEADKELLNIANTITSDSSSLSIHRGTVVSSNVFPSPKELFNKIKQVNPFSIDMETSAFYQIAWLLNIKVLAVRGISNIINEHGDDDYIRDLDVKTSSKNASIVTLKILDLLSDKYTASQIKLAIKQESKLAANFSEEARHLIRTLGLQEHPEGGYFAQTFKSSCLVKPLNNSADETNVRSSGTSIYYLLSENDFSAWHRLKSDETWHYYKGSPLVIHSIDINGDISTHILGDSFQNINATFQLVIPAGYWFAAELLNKGSYSLVGCTVTPGFEFHDFELANRDNLLEKYPSYEVLIKQLTRD